MGFFAPQFPTRCTEQRLDWRKHQDVRIAQLRGSYHSGKESGDTRTGRLHRSGKGQHLAHLPSFGRTAYQGICRIVFINNKEVLFSTSLLFYYEILGLQMISITFQIDVLDVLVNFYKHNSELVFQKWLKQSHKECPFLQLMI